MYGEDFPTITGNEFLDREPRAAALSVICLQVIDAAENLIHSDEEETWDQALELLIALDKQLQDSGIEPDMHVFSEDDPLASGRGVVLSENPIIFSEWIAGQIRDLIGALPTTNGGTLSDLISEPDDFNVSAAVLDRQNPKLQAYFLFGIIPLRRKMTGHSSNGFASQRALERARVILADSDPHGVIFTDLDELDPEIIMREIRRRFFIDPDEASLRLRAAGADPDENPGLFDALDDLAEYGVSLDPDKVDSIALFFADRDKES